MSCIIVIERVAQLLIGINIILLDGISDYIYLV